MTLSKFEYSPWRHGGWYVHNVKYASGAIGCVSRNYEDRKWRIACDPRPFEEQPTFRTRDEAAEAEMELARLDRERYPYHVEIADGGRWLQVGSVNPAATVEGAKEQMAEAVRRWSPGSRFRISGPNGVEYEDVELAS